MRSGSVSERESDGEIGESETGDRTYYLAPEDWGRDNWLRLGAHPGD